MADSNGRRRLLACSDARLAPLLDASGEETRRARIEALVVEALPLVRRVLGRYAARGGALTAQDADDVAAEVSLRLVRRLQEFSSGDGEPIERFVHYAATVTYNAVYDVFRQRFPERRRLKNRLKYVLGRDRRFDLWTTAAGLVAGLRAWSGREAAAETLLLAERERTAGMRDARRPAEALAAIFKATGAPLLFDVLLELVAELWNVRDDAQAASEPVDRPLPSVALEARQELALLWSEIEQLGPLHRAALLLNLRDPGGANVVAILLFAGVATVEQIAAAAGMPVEALTALWSELPLDDLRIADMLGLTRQQVINLRQSARMRLARRIAERNQVGGR
jgi:RNA polymerase sigma factor (sigma-70 family)